MTRLFALAQRYGWEIGYLDEVWWSRVSQPNMHSWSEQDEPLRLQELAVDKHDLDRHPRLPVTACFPPPVVACACDLCQGAPSAR